MIFQHLFLSLKLPVSPIMMNLNIYENDIISQVKIIIIFCEVIWLVKIFLVIKYYDFFRNEI
jgi:hypothetical protein